MVVIHSLEKGGKDAIMLLYVLYQPKDKNAEALEYINELWNTCINISHYVMNTHTH